MIRLGQPKPAAGGTTRGASKHGALRQRTLEGSVECVLGGTTHVHSYPRGAVAAMLAMLASACSSPAAPLAPFAGSAAMRPATCNPLF